MERKIYRWGILGPGKIANKFATDLKVVPGAELYAVASRSKERADEFALAHKVPFSYGSYEEMLKNEEVDVVYIASPHVFHYEHSLLCLKRKKAVLCEKPLAINSIQVREMIRVAKEENVFLMEALWTYFLPHYRFILDLVQNKTYGEIKHIKADFGFAAPFLPEKRLYNLSLGGGSLLDIGIYPVFAALSLLGRPKKIDATASICDTGVDESCSIKFLYENGAVAELSSAINNIIPTIAVLTFENAVVTLLNRFHEPTEVVIQTEDKEETATFDVQTFGYNFEAEHVQDMLRRERIESDIMTFEMSLLLMESLDRIRERIQLKYEQD